MCNCKIKQTLEYDTYIKYHPVVPTCFYAVLLFPFKVLLITTVSYFLYLSQLYGQLIL